MKALVVLIAAAALLGAAPATAADRVVERGIVQSIDASTVLLRALDGTEVQLALGPETRFRLNGRAVTVDTIRHGFVAEVVTVGAGPATVVRAFGREASDSGRIVFVRPRAIVVRRGPGDVVRIRVTPRTSVWRAGSRVRLAALRPGMRVEVVRAVDGSARLVLLQGKA